MSFLSDLFEGKTSNLGNDLAPSNIFSDTVKDTGGSNTIPELLGGAALAFGGLGLAGGLGGLGLGAGAVADATAGAPLDLLAGGAAAGTADASAAGTLFAGGLDASALAGGGLDLSALGLTDDATSAFAADPALSAINSAAPLGTTAGATGTGVDSLTAAPSWASDLTSNELLSGTGVSGNTAGTFAATPAGTSPSFLSSLETGAVNSITKNPLGIAIAGGALGYDVLKGNPNSAAENQLNANASTLTAQGAQIEGLGTQLTQYLQSGTLPPGQQAAVTQAVQARKAQIIANAAANGQNTNPTQNSALAQDLANADQNGLVMAGQLESQLATTGTQLISAGLNATGLSSQIYEALVKIDQTNNSTLMSAIASMAAALGGGTKIQIGGTPATP